MQPKTKEHEQAFNLFFQTDYTRKQIADILNIDRKTLFTWAKEGEWLRAKNTIRHAPSFLVEQYYDQLNEINRAVAERTDRPYPTKEEATIIKTISATIKQIGKRQSVSDAIDVFTDFSLEVSRYDPEFQRELIQHMDKYIKRLDDNGQAKYTDRYHWERNQDKEYEKYRAEQEELAKPDAPTEASVKKDEEQWGDDEQIKARHCACPDDFGKEPARPLCEGATKQPRETQPAETNSHPCNIIPFPPTNGAIMGSSTEGEETTEPAIDATNQNNSDVKDEQKNENGVMEPTEIIDPNTPFHMPQKNITNGWLLITNCVGTYIIDIFPVGGKRFPMKSDKPEYWLNVSKCSNGPYIVEIIDRSGRFYKHEITIANERRRRHKDSH